MTTHSPPRAIGLAAVLVAVAGAGFAATRMEQAVAARHANFKEQGAAFKALNDELKKDAPAKAVLAASALKLKSLSTQLPTWFPRGSGPESGSKTEAKPSVWTDAAGFSAAANRLQVEASKLQQFAAAGDVAGLKVQARAVGGACKACHDKFREADRK